MKPPAPPTATYRLQFNRDFTFADATRIIPYLQQLGVSHVYASPYLRARAGSRHGYDIVDHNALNPEIGGEAEFEEFVATLRQHGMGQILDIVPNHMGVGGDDNGWWLDVLENGEASYYAPYFDIDWRPAKAALHNKVLLPFLGDHYGTVLESGALTPEFDRQRGAFSVRYYEHLFPLDPRTYPQILSVLEQRLESAPIPAPATLDKIQSIIELCRAIPRRVELSPARRQRRCQETFACKQRLADLCRQHPQLGDQIDQVLEHLKGTPEQVDSFDPLHRLLEDQAYRLAYWQVAADEINYRRFFDINDLAGLRVENPEVFRVTHRLIRQLIGAGQVQGLRIDHLDGLFDPLKYCNDLQQMVGDARADNEEQGHPPFYVIIEKVLAGHERLSDAWPVAGTTGYETAHLLNGLFVRPDGETRLTRIYTGVSHGMSDFDTLLYQRKKLIIKSSLSSELNVLANLLSGIAQADRHTRDFTLHGLREALAEIVACFPVYRTYISATHISEVDRRHLRWAVAQAKRRNPATEILIFDFIHGLLRLEGLEHHGTDTRQKVIQFVQRFQQYTAPVTAKGMEDTAFYSYNRLVSLNDVGFDPRTFGVTTAAFHEENRQRLQHWPHGMVTSSTHDSKRSEDVRVRIDVLSEIADEWRQHLTRWRRLNRRKKRQTDDRHVPSGNDEYLLYQTLVGAWPQSCLCPPADIDSEAFERFRGRIEAYMIKAIREAKIHTSWINPNEEYEAAMKHFVQTLLHDPAHNAFIADFLTFQRRAAHLGLFNSLSQTALKLTMPGIPDIYQGNELLRFNLVDPDNRRPVDYRHNRERLRQLAQRAESGESTAALARELIEHIEDGGAKLYLTWKTLNLRRAQPELFHRGDYLGLATEGHRADHICAFARRFEGKEIVSAAPRWFARLMESDDGLPLGSPLWDDTWVEAPESAAGKTYRNLLTDSSAAIERRQGKSWFLASSLFSDFSVALLTSE